MTRDQHIERRRKIAWLGLVMLLMLLAVMSAERDTCPLSGTCGGGEDAVGCSADGQFLAAISPLLSGSGLRALACDRPIQESAVPAEETRRADAFGVALHTQKILYVAPKTSPPLASC